jgi:hypothetical protein
MYHYEMILASGKKVQFVARSNLDAKRVAVRNGAKSLYQIKWGIPLTQKSI